MRQYHFGLRVPASYQGAREAGEDIKLLGGVGDEDITDSVIETSSNRFSWLFVNLITAVIASIVIGFFDIYTKNLFYLM